MATLAITITEDKEGDIDKWRKSHKRKRERARDEFYATVKSSDS